MIRAEMSFEVVATSPQLSHEALKSHIEKLSSLPMVEMEKVEYGDAREIEFGKEKRKVYSSVAHCSLSIKSLYDLVNIIIVYGPSSIEILSPERMEVDMGEMQNIANVVAGIMHRFAEAGIGGVVINPRG